MKWILFWFLIGLILANCCGCILTIRAKNVQSRVEWEAEYSVEY